MVGDVGLFRAEGEVLFSSGDKLALVFENKALVLVVLESIDE